MKADLHLLNPAAKLNNHKIFVNDEKGLESFRAEDHFNTTQKLAENNMLDILPQALTVPINIEKLEGLKYKYNRLAEYVEKDRKLTKIMMKLSYDKAVLGKERSKIKKEKGKKIHKFFIERKK